MSKLVIGNIQFADAYRALAELENLEKQLKGEKMLILQDLEGKKIQILIANDLGKTIRRSEVVKVIHIDNEQYPRMMLVERDNAEREYVPITDKTRIIIKES